MLQVLKAILSIANSGEYRIVKILLQDNAIAVTMAAI